MEWFGEAAGVAGFVTGWGACFYVWRVMHHMIRNLQNELDRMEQKMIRNQARISKLEAALKNNGVPLPNGNHR